MPTTVEPAYEAHNAELTLRTLLDNLSGKQMHNLLHEFLRTREIMRNGQPVTSAPEITDALLETATVANGTMPEKAQVEQAVRTYQNAKAPSLSELEKRYARLMERLTHPGKLSDVDAHTVGNANTYLTLAAAITRHVKYEAAPKFTDEEIREVARLYEHYVNVKIYNDPWHGTEKHPQRHPFHFLVQGKKETELSYAARQMLEADMLVQRIYIGELVRPHIDAPRRGRVKTEYWHDHSVFAMTPTLDMQSSFDQIAEHMLAPHKTDSASAWAYIPKLSHALELYQQAFANWQQCYDADIQARKQHAATSERELQALLTEEAEFTATNAFRRCLHDLKCQLAKQDFSEDSVNKITNLFAARIGTMSPAKQVLEGAIVQTLNGPQEQTSQNASVMAGKIATNSRFSEILAIADTLTPYINTRQLHYPHLPYARHPFSPEDRPAALVNTELLARYGVFDKGEAHRSRFTD